MAPAIGGIVTGMAVAGISTANDGATATEFAAVGAAAADEGRTLL